MKKLAVSLLFLLAGCATIGTSQSIEWQPVGTADWQPGETGTGETGKGKTMTSTNSSGDGYLLSKSVYGDFELVVEFKPDKQVNSGILIRCQDRENITPLTCLEINIWDDHPRQEFRTGAIVIHAAPPLAQVNTVDQWNTYRIVAQGQLVEAWLNGVLTARMTNAELTEGFIALQSQNGEVSFRDIELNQFP